MKRRRAKCEIRKCHRSRHAASFPNEKAKKRQTCAANGSNTRPSFFFEHRNESGVSRRSGRRGISKAVIQAEKSALAVGGTLFHSMDLSIRTSDSHLRRTACNEFPFSVVFVSLADRPPAGDYFNSTGPFDEKCCLPREMNHRSRAIRVTGTREKLPGRLSRNTRDNPRNFKGEIRPEHGDR